MAALAIACLSWGCEYTSQVPGRDVVVKPEAVAAYVQKGEAITTLLPSITASFANTPTPGNLLIASVSNPVTSLVINTPPGWQVAHSNVIGIPGLSIFYKMAGASESKDVTVDGYAITSLVHGLSISEFSGVDASNPPTVMTGSGGAFPSYTFPSVTTPMANSLVYVVASDISLIAAPTFSGWTNGFIEISDFEVPLLGLNMMTTAYLSAGAVASYNTKANGTANGSIYAASLAFGRRPTPTTDFTVSAGNRSATLHVSAAAAPFSHLLVLAKATDCSFGTDPVGTATTGTSLGGGVSILFNEVLTQNLTSKNVMLDTMTTVTYNSTTGTIAHGALTAGTRYCYKAIARNLLALDDSSGAGRPQRLIRAGGGTTDPVYMFAADTASLAAPSVLPGTGAFYGDNGGKVMAVSTSGARWFTPLSLSNGVQSRGTVGNLGVETDATLFEASLNGTAHAIWATGSSPGTLRWTADANTAMGGNQALGDAIYAAPLVTKTPSRVFVGTRNTGSTQNRLFALNATTGACVWAFNGNCSGSTTSLNVGQISAMPIYDPTTQLLLFTSAQLNGGSTLWALDANDSPSVRNPWSYDIGSSDSSISFTNTTRNQFYVGTNAGRIYKRETSTGNNCWWSTTDTCRAPGNGTEQYFCANASDTRGTSCMGGSAILKGLVALNGAQAGSFIFSTVDGNVRRVSDAGALMWKTQVSGASAPLALADVGAGLVYVGGNDGLVHELSLSTGVSTGRTRDAGGGTVVVGDPSYDGTAHLLFVNTSQGAHYAFTVPF